ncbi:MAG: hypothetical protein R2706_04830 [Acidimicrobiales bacterium]
MDLFYSAKGGSGCSTIAAGFALVAAKRTPTLLVDCAGNLDLLLGLRPGRVAPDLGLTDWLGASDPPPDALARLERPITAGLSLLPFGRHGWDADAGRLQLLASLLAHDGRRSVVDVGGRFADCAALASRAEQTVLVSRSCYLDLAAACNLPTPDALVLIMEAGRALRPGDFQAALGLRRSVVVAWDAKIARSIDSGTAVAELGRQLSDLTVLL